ILLDESGLRLISATDMWKNPSSRRQIFEATVVVTGENSLEIGHELLALALIEDAAKDPGEWWIRGCMQLSIARLPSIASAGGNAAVSAAARQAIETLRGTARAGLEAVARSPGRPEKDAYVWPLAVLLLLSGEKAFDELERYIGVNASETPTALRI